VASELETNLASVGAGPQTLPSTGLRRGRLPLPVEGRIRKRFGIEFDTQIGARLRRTGIEIAAERGTRVQAVAKGRVLFAGPVAGYGQVVILDHGASSVSVSGYLEAVALQAGDVLDEGDTLGSIGPAPSLDGPGLYFALSRNGELVDPAAWFR